MSGDDDTKPGDDTLGHNFKYADTERDETADTEGRSFHIGADVERAETDDTGGHNFHYGGADAERDETDNEGTPNLRFGG